MSADEKKRKRNIPDQRKHRRKLTKKIFWGEFRRGKKDTDYSGICCECWKNCFKTSKADWIQWTKCGKCLHETCSMYELFCDACGRDDKRKKM